MAWKQKGGGRIKTKEPMQKKRHIMIGIPIEHASDGLGIGVYRFLHLLQSLNHREEHPFRYSWQITSDKIPVEWARNLITGMFLKSDAEKLWFIDNDMIPDQQALLMLKVDADIVAGMALAFDHGNEEKGKPTRMKLCLFKHNDEEETFNPIIPAEGQTLAEIDAAGTATMLIDRKVLEDRRLWYDTEYFKLDGTPVDLRSEMEDPEWGPPVFRFNRKPNGQPMRGEDIDFSWRAKQLGYRVVGCPGIRFGHNKFVNLDTVLDLVNNTAEAYGSAIMQEAQNNADEDQTEKQDRQAALS